MREEKVITTGTYLQELIEQKKREVAARRNDAGLVSMWPEAIKEVLPKFPNLGPVEKSALRGNVEGQIRRLCQVTKRDQHMFTPALK